ncbi:hypothetical protein VE02_08733 [Pseudogymnoascus sp. 03VT05]|nr:hypothetical protein VE02_08733 [Pseudogymnoascus sp. 03VT05]
MSNASPQSDVTLIDSEESLLPLLDSIGNLPVEPPSLYIDLEGIALGRHGSISIISIHISPTKKTYLVDIHSLKEAAFSITTTTRTSLKTILESPTIPKVIFDIRNDSDALFSLFKISVDGIRDLQVMELATRRGSRQYVSSLAKCIEYGSPISSTDKFRWRVSKERGVRLFAPEKGGRYEVFNERPLNPEIMQYCHLDVALLPGLYNIYSAKLRPSSQALWRAHIPEQTKLRIKESQSPSYDPRSKSKALGWDDEEVDRWIDAWNDDIMMEHMSGISLPN